LFEAVFATENTENTEEDEKGGSVSVTLS